MKVLKKRHFFYGCLPFLVGVLGHAVGPRDVYYDVYHLVPEEEPTGVLSIAEQDDSAFVTAQANQRWFYQLIEMIHPQPRRVTLQEFEAVLLQKVHLVNTTGGFGGGPDLDDSQNTLLHWAAEKGDLEVIEVLMRRGADKEARNKYGVTPLGSAVIAGQIRVVDLLIDQYQANPYARSYVGSTLLHLAAQSYFPAMIKHLMTRHPLPLEEENHYQKTPLRLAVSSGDPWVVRQLIESGADQEVRTPHGQTLLH